MVAVGDAEAAPAPAPMLHRLVVIGDDPVGVAPAGPRNLPLLAPMGVPTTSQPPGLVVERWDSDLATSSIDIPGPPRSPDDHYVLYTGGTTGLPKGVVWRQEDIFFAAMGGGGWGAAPIGRPEELVDRIPTGRGSAAVMLVMAPLMHGNAQWATWSGFFMGGTVVLYTEPTYDPATVLRLIAAERVVSVALVGDAMARPLAEALATAPPGTYDTGSLLAIGSGGAMLSAPVKEELSARLPGVMIMDRFGASESGAQGAVEHGSLGPRFVMGAHTSVLDDELRPLAPGDGRIGRLARTGRIPLGYYKDPAKTAATFPTDPDGTRWSVPGDLASIEADGTITVLGRGSASINSGGEKIFPEEVEAAIKSHPDVFDAIVIGVPDERFGEQVAALVRPRRPDAPMHPRGHPGALPTVSWPATRCPVSCSWSRRSRSLRRESPTARRLGRFSERPPPNGRRDSRHASPGPVHRRHRGHHPARHPVEHPGIDLDRALHPCIGPDAHDPAWHRPPGPVEEGHERREGEVCVPGRRREHRRR